MLAPSMMADRPPVAARPRSGQLEPGNIDLFGQPSVPNPRGGRSTVQSFSVNVDGREVLLPTVMPDGRLLSEDDAVKEYERTGRHLGIFSDPQSATAYAKQLHEDYAAGRYRPKPMKADGFTDPASVRVTPPATARTSPAVPFNTPRLTRGVTPRRVVARTTDIALPVQMPRQAETPQPPKASQSAGPLEALSKAKTIRADPQRTVLDRAESVVRAPAAGLVRVFTKPFWGALEAAADTLGLESVAEWSRAATKQADEIVKTVRGPQTGSGPTEQAIYQGLESVGVTLPALAAGAATGSPSVALSLMGGATAGEAYPEAREAGASPLKAMGYAAVQGVTEVLTEKIPASRLLGDLAKRTGLIKTLLRQAAVEVPGEQVATFVQDLSNWTALHPEKPLSEFPEAAKNAAYQTLVSTLVGTIVQTGGAVGVSRAAEALAKKPSAAPEPAVASPTAPAAPAFDPAQPFTVTSPETPMERPQQGTGELQVYGVRPQVAPARLQVEPGTPLERLATQEERNAQARAEVATEPPARTQPEWITQGREVERRVAQGISPTGEERRSFPTSGTSEVVDVSPPKKERDEHTFSSTQVNLPEEHAAAVIQMAKAIPDADIAENGRAGDSEGAAPHVTVKYGLHTTDVEEVRKVLADEPPITVTLGATSFFPGSESGNGDVVKIDVDSPDMHRLNAKIAEALKTTDTHPTYTPHVTVAYVKEGKGQQYSGDETLKGRTITLDSIRFSTKDGKIFEIPLTGLNAAAVATPEPSADVAPTRPYLTPDMKPSAMMAAYVKATWGSTFKQQDIVDGVLRATASGSRGRPNENGAPFWRVPAKNLGEQKVRVREWMDWMDRGLAEHEAQQDRELGPRPTREQPRAVDPDESTQDRSQGSPAKWTQTQILAEYVRRNEKPEDGSFEGGVVSDRGRALASFADRTKRRGWVPSASLAPLDRRGPKEAKRIAVGMAGELVDMGVLQRAWDRQGEVYYAAADAAVPKHLTTNPTDEWFETAPVDTPPSEAQTEGRGSEPETGESVGETRDPSLDRVAASVPTRLEGQRQREARRNSHVKDVWTVVLRRAKAVDPKVTPKALRKEFDTRLAIIDDLDSEFRESGHNPRVLLEAIAKAGGISVATEEGGGYSGELKWLRESAAGPYGNFAGVTKVFQKRTVNARGKTVTGHGLDDMVRYLSQEPEFAHIQSIEDLFAALEDVARMGDVGARGAVYPGTKELAERAGMRLDEAWWKDSWQQQEQPEEQAEPEPLNAESYQKAFGGTKEQAEAILAVYEAMGIPMDRVFVVKWGTGGELTQGERRTFRYMRNTQKSPDMGERFGQHVEPAGRYIVDVEGSTAEPPKGFESGTITFENPLVIDFGGGYQDADNWKRVLSTRYGGKVGEALSRAIVADGYDGIVTMDTDKRGDRHTSEIVDLSTFSQTKQPRLVVLHNIHVDGLIHADKMGGLAVPSLGVVREGDAYSGMGNITLIGRPHLGDPKVEPIYDADVWSQTFPRPEYRKATSKAVQPVVDALRPFAEKFENNRRAIDTLWDNAVNQANPQDTVSSLLRSNATKAWFLSTQGVSVEPVIRDVRLALPWVQYLDYERFRQVVPFNDERTPEAREQALHDVVPILREAIDKYLTSSSDGRATAKLSKKAQRKAYVGDAQAEARWRAATVFGIGGEWVNEPNGEMPMSLDWKITDAHNNVGKREVDEGETEKLLNEALKGREVEFKAWLEEKALGLHPPPHVTVGRTKRPYTLHNIVDAMTGRVRAVQSHLTFGEGKARAAAAKKFTELEQMRRWADANIRPEEEIDEGREQAKKAIGEWRDQVVKYYGGYGSSEFGRVWEGLDASMRALARWAKGRKDADTLLNALTREGFERVPIDVARDGVRAGMLWLKAPVPYFEAKPQRAVMLNEFAGAAVPKSADPQVHAILDKHGIRYREYDDSGKDTDPEFQKAEAIRALEEELEREGVKVLFQGPRGSVEFTDHGHAVIRALENPNVSTGLHETAHVARRFLFDRSLPIEVREAVSDEDILTAEEWAGAKDGTWDRDAEEKFARGFERYMADGEAPTASLQALFDKFARWLAKVYQRIAGSPIDIEISPAMKQVFDRLVTRSERLEDAVSFDVADLEGEIDKLYQDGGEARIQAARRALATIRAQGFDIETFDEETGWTVNDDSVSDAGRGTGQTSRRAVPAAVKKALAAFNELSEAEGDRLINEPATLYQDDRKRKSDLFDTGEEQPRLPGAEDVREQDIKTPEFEAPFTLTGQASKAKKGKQDTLFQDGPRDEKRKRITVEQLATVAARRKMTIEAVRKVAEQAGYAIVDEGPRPVRVESDREIPPTKPIPADKVHEFPSIQKMPAAIRSDIEQMLQDYHGFEQQRRGVQSWDRTTELAKDLWLPLETLTPGKALNAEELHAYQTAIATALTMRKPLLEKIQDGTATDWERVEASHLTDVATVLTASYRGAKAETGRALNILRVKARVLDLRESAFLERAMKAPGFNNDLLKLSKEALDAAGDPLKQLQILRRRAGTLYDYLQAIYYANLLSGLKTHLRNTIGNSFNVVANTLTPLGAAPADYIRAKRTGSDRTVYLGEIPHSVVGAAIGVQQGFKNAMFTFTQGFRPSTVKTAASGEFDTPRVELPGGLLNPFNYPARALESADEFFRAIAWSQEMYAGAYVQARGEEGLTHDGQVAARMAEILTAADPTSADGAAYARLARAADTFAARAVFQEEAGPITNWLLGAKSQTKPLPLRMAALFIAPFIKTPAAIMRQGFEWSPAGFAMRGVRAAQGREGSQAMGRALLGSAFLLGPIAWLAATGRLTGAPPDDPGEREEFYAQGKLANAVRIGDYWVRYVLFQPFSVGMAAMANGWEKFQDSDQDAGAAEDAFITAIAGAGASLLDQSFLSGLGTFIDAVNDPKRYAGQWLSLFAQGFVPFSGMARNITQAVDPVFRRPEGVKESVQAIIPGASASLPARRDRFGAEAKRQGSAVQRGFVVPEVSKAVDDDIIRTLASLKVRPITPRADLTIRGEQVTLSRADADVLVEALGRERKVAIESAIRNAGFARREDDVKVDILERAMVTASRTVRGRATRAYLQKEAFTVEGLVSARVTEAMRRDREAMFGPDERARATAR